MSRTHLTVVTTTLAILAMSLLSACGTGEYKDSLYTGVRHEIEADFQKELEALAPVLVEPANDDQPIPEGYSPWWDASVRQSLFNSPTKATTLTGLCERAIVHSTQIKVFSDIPLIRETGIQEAEGLFDPHVFATALYAQANEPVGSTLQTGGPDRFWEEEISLEMGINKKFADTGGVATLSQKFARIHNNSIFFVPNPQAQAVLTISIDQPLLRKGWKEYNRSRIRIAQFDSEVAKDEFIRQAESHLMEITRSYWGLYFARGVCLQKRKLVAQTREVVDEMRARRNVDTISSQLARATSALGARRAELMRSELAVRNIQDRIKALINDPELPAGTNEELTPDDTPLLGAHNVDMKQAAQSALANRPEIDQAFWQFKAAIVRANMQENELLPKLDWYVEGSLNGLDNNGLFSAEDDQWHNMGFLTMLKFDYPLGNNEAEARYRRRRLEVRQQTRQISTTISTVLLEVKIAVRYVRTAYSEMLARYEGVLAAREDIAAVQGRRSVDGSDSSSLFLDMLLDAQQRWADAEEAFLQSIVAYNVAMVNLERVKGTLLEYKNLEIVETTDEESDLPVLQLQKVEPKTEAEGENVEG